MTFKSLLELSIFSFSIRRILVAEDSTDCPPCDCGLYCDSPGLTAPRGQCDPGFLCYGGAYTSGPTDGVTGDYCTAGGYCEAGKQILHLCQYLTT